jgi:hypothetical protein
VNLLLVARSTVPDRMSRTILVPHDGYEMSDNALKYATELAKGLNMKIKLIRVVAEVIDVSTMGIWNNIERARVKRDVERARPIFDRRNTRNSRNWFHWLTRAVLKHPH